MDRDQPGGLAKTSLERVQGASEFFEKPEATGYKEVSIDRLHPDPDQPRKGFPEESLQSMAETIRKVGIVQPLTVQFDAGTRDYRIVTGERRFRAAKIAGMDEIPCLIREVTEEQRLLHQIIENLHKEDINPIERAEGIKLRRWGERNPRSVKT